MSVRADRALSPTPPQTLGAHRAPEPVDQVSAESWSAVLARFDAAIREGDDFEVPSGAETAALGPVPPELQELAAELLAACEARIRAVQAEMDGVADELSSLQQASRGSRGGQYRATGVDDRSAGVGHLV